MLTSLLLLTFIEADRCEQWYLKYDTIYDCLDDKSQTAVATQTIPVSPVISLTSPITTTPTTTSTSKTTTTTTSLSTPDSTESEELDTTMTTATYTPTTLPEPTVTASSAVTRFENQTNAAQRQSWWRSPFGIIGLM